MLIRRFRGRLTFANVMSVAAVFIALGGTAWAISANSVGSRQIKPGAVGNSDIADDAVTSPKVADGSLRSTDFGTGQLPAGAPGPQGEQGVPGRDGSPDTPQQVLDKLTQVDGKSSGLDADTVRGRPMEELASQEINLTTSSFAQSAPDDPFNATVYCDPNLMQLIMSPTFGYISGTTGVSNIMVAVDGVEAPATNTNSYNLANGVGRGGAPLPTNDSIRIRMANTTGDAAAEIQLVVATNHGTYSAALHMFHRQGATPFCEANGTVTPGV
jgi:hypothetical protein